MKSKEVKTKISHAHSLILPLNGGAVSRGVLLAVFLSQWFFHYASLSHCLFLTMGLSLWVREQLIVKHLQTYVTQEQITHSHKTNFTLRITFRHI